MSQCNIAPLGRDPDWFSLKLLSDERAAESLKDILVSLEGIEERVFARRGLALLMFDERGLYRHFTDPEVGLPFQSCDRWLKHYCPKSWRYATEAKSTILALKTEIQPKDLADIPRCNLHHLVGSSSNVRALPDVIEAAKTMPEKKFVAEVLNAKYQQHREVRQPVTLASPEVCTIFEKAVERVTILYGCKSRGEALEYIGQAVLEMYPLEQEEWA